MAELTSGLKYERIRELASRSADELFSDGYVVKSFRSKDDASGKWRAILPYTYTAIVNGKTESKPDRITLTTNAKCYRSGNRGKDDAEGQLKTWRSQVIADIATVKGQTDNATKTVPDYTEMVIRNRLNLGAIEASTARAYREYVKYIREGLADCLISELDPKRVSEWVASLTSNGYSPSTIHKACNVLRCATSVAVRDGDLSRDPTIGIDLPKMHAKKPSILDDDGIRAVFKMMDNEMCGHTPTDNGICMALALRGGLRDSEIAGLRWSDCTFEHDATGMISGVRCRIEQAIGRGYGGAYEKEVKTAAGRRVLFLPADVANDMWAKRLEVAEKALAHGVSINDLFVLTPIVPRKRASSDRLHEDPHWISQRMARAFKKAGIKCADGTPCTAHALRRTFASVAERSGLTVSQLTACLGHAVSNMVTFTNYATANDNVAIDAWSKVNSEFNSILNDKQEAKVLPFKAVNE